MGKPPQCSAGAAPVDLLVLDVQGRYLAVWQGNNPVEVIVRSRKLLDPPNSNRLSLRTPRVVARFNLCRQRLDKF